MVEPSLQAGGRFPIERLSKNLDRRTVVFFYPAAMTGGCTREVRRFNDLLGDFDRTGVDVIGASVDQPELNAEFCDVEELRYELVSDPGMELAEELGILKEIGDLGLVSARYTYLIEADGTILEIWKVGRGGAIDEHPDEVLERARELGTSV